MANPITPNVPNIPSPDPSLATNERLAHAIAGVKDDLRAARSEIKGWVEALQLLQEKELNGLRALHEVKIGSAEDKTDNLDRVVQTRLAGSETALNAAMAAADKVTQKQADNFDAVLNESKIGMTKQIDSLNDKIDDLKERMAESGGKSQGKGETMALIIAVVAAVTAVVAVGLSLSDRSGRLLQPTAISRIP